MELNEEFEGLAVEIGQSRPSSPALERRGIVVSGSHRSGTSALARVLSLLGCDLAKHLMPPRYGNELGFWEPEEVVNAHDVFLGSIGSSWDDVAALPDGAFVSAAARELRQQLALLLHDEYGTSPLFVVKDPRISRLLPLWLAVLAELQIAPAIALAVRNPLEVAASLKARDGFTTTKSLLLWLRYTVEAEQHSRGRPRSIVMYDELLRDWQGVLARVGEDLAVTWPGRSHRATVEIENFLSEQHRHQVFDWRDVEGRADVVSWVKEAYFALRATDSVPVLDQVRDELAQADIAFGPILEEVRLELHESREQTLQGAAARDALGSALEARSLALEARAAEVQQLQERVTELDSAVADSASRAATHQAEAAALHAERDHLAHEVNRFGDDVRHLLTDLEAARATVAQLEEQAAGANAALGALEAQATLERDELLQELTGARADAEQANARILAVDSEATAERRQMLADVDSANAEANRLATQLEEMSLDAEELAATANELLLIADAGLDASRAEQDRLRADVAGALEEQGQLLILVETLEAALESAAAALTEPDQAAALAEEFAARRAEFNAERFRLLGELGAVRTDLDNARSQVELVQNELELLRSEAGNDRAALIAERDAARTEEERLAADFETVQTDAERLASRTEELEAALAGHKALVQVLQSVSKRRTPRRRTLSHLGTWLLPPTPRKLNYLRQYLLLRWSGEFDVDLYLLANPDVLAAGINPLMHYVQYGRGEGRAVDGSIELPNAADAIEASSSDAIDPTGGQVPSLTVKVGSADGEQRDDLQVPTIQTLGGASAVDELIRTAFPLLRPLRVFPTPTKHERRLNLVTDSLNEGSLFGGVGTSIILASLLAQRLDASLRIVTRLVPPNPANFGVVQRSHGVEFDRNVEFVSVPVVGHESLPLHEGDRFLTTSWWSTWSTVRAVSPERVVYLIQEDERMFYPAGDEHAACAATIADSRIRFVVNTVMLRDHFVQEGFSNVGGRGIPFEPAFPEKLYFHDARPADDPRRTFFFYARPNNVRNLFLHGLAAIDEAISANILDPAEWRFHFVGSSIPTVQLNCGVTPVVSENLPWPAYAALIRGVDLGLSLMSTPHPSYPPLDLAACGAVAVTNRYGVKRDLNSYSSNIICSDLAHDAIVDGIAAGVRLAQDRKTRHRNYETQQLSRSWDSSLSAVLDQLSGWI